MADIEVLRAALSGGRLTRLQVKMVGVRPREISRDTALSWLAGGHSLIPVAGHGHATVRGAAIERIDVGEEAFLRTDTRVLPEDSVQFPAVGH